MQHSGTKEKAEQLKILLTESNYSQDSEIIKLVDSIICGSVSDHSNSVSHLYNNIFFKKSSENEMNFDAFKLNILNLESKIILLNTQSMVRSGSTEKLENPENPENLENIIELLESIIESKEGQNYIIRTGHGYTAIIYELNSGNDAKEFAMAAADSVMNEFGIKVSMGIGNVYSYITEAKRSFDEALISLRTGQMLLENEIVYEYDKLGMAKVVYEMEEEQCEKLLNEILSPEALKELENKEMLESINTFFKSDLNISVAARKLYVHRNTIVYRIEKFNKISGYDLSSFEDAALIKLALIIRRKLM